MEESLHDGVTCYKSGLVVGLPPTYVLSDLLQRYSLEQRGNAICSIDTGLKIGSLQVLDGRTRANGSFSQVVDNKEYINRLKYSRYWKSKVFQMSSDFRKHS